jgi:hypothetical protein
MQWHKPAAYFALGFLVALTCTANAQDQSLCAIDVRTAPAASDNKHAFDFELGTWKAHTWRRLKPLSGSSIWDQYEGIEVVRKVGSGAAILLEFYAEGPAGHLDGLSLRMYDAAAQRWTLYYPGAASGATLIAATGSFIGDQVEFCSQDAFDGKAIVVRSAWSASVRDARFFERSFSVDGRRTWEVNWITTYTRVDASDEVR